MKYYFTKDVLKKIELQKKLIECGNHIRSGFLTGDSFGKTFIIKDIIFIDFSTDNFEKIYSVFLKTYQSKLLGTVSVGKAKFNSELCSEDLHIEL